MTSVNIKYVVSHLMYRLLSNLMSMSVHCLNEYNDLMTYLCKM